LTSVKYSTVCEGSSASRVGRMNRLVPAAPSMAPSCPAMPAIVCTSPVHPCPPAHHPNSYGNTVLSFSRYGQQSAAKENSTTFSRSDIRLIQYMDSSAHGLVRRWRLIGYFLIHYYPVVSALALASPPATGRERMSSPNLQTLQDPILLQTLGLLSRWRSSGGGFPNPRCPKSRCGYPLTRVRRWLALGHNTPHSASPPEDVWVSRCADTRCWVCSPAGRALGYHAAATQLHSLSLTARSTPHAVGSASSASHRRRGQTPRTRGGVGYLWLSPLCGSQAPDYPPRTRTARPVSPPRPAPAPPGSSTLVDDVGWHVCAREGHAVLME
jgi:hypothetical protein